MSRLHRFVVVTVCAYLLVHAIAANSQGVDAARPGTRVLMDAHNCYPYGEWWADRIDRALSAGTPLAIEQDLLWYADPKSGTSRSVVSHGAPASGNEPSMRDYFFERVRPIIERALRDPDHRQWPLITLNLDLKSEEPEHLHAIRQLLEQYRDWITTAPRLSDIRQVAPLDVKPILVLTGESDAQRRVFYDEQPVGSRLLVFGAVHPNMSDPMAPPEILEPQPADNYHRWWNNPWKVVEAGGQNVAGDWTLQDNARLVALVRHAHSQGLWIRFYTLDGASSEELSCHGWFRSYNFGSRISAETRWTAAARAGVDYIASDQYEELARVLRVQSTPNRSDPPE